MNEERSHRNRLPNLAQQYQTATSISPLLILSNAAVSTPRILSRHTQDPQNNRSISTESDKENLSVVPPVPITAPVPVLYASLGKEALKSILSIGDEGTEEGHTLEESTPQAHIFTENTNIVHSSATIQTSYERCFMENNTETLQEKATVIARPTAVTQRTPVPTRQQGTPIVIRPISPSTLMALTDPCLMEWCTLPIKEDAETEAAFRVSEEALYQLTLAQGFYACNWTNMKPSGPNLWGY
ncbi:unnamed protein product [Cyclocybe aegerita]|uniref:Uncharacterized protein n=1 Tax=Cyclocybe aegerita TaxID=1973307 RepID=A0A8S0VXC1_CYCAE|nr:unnamed protein product [Cyclocybe aegerita]